MVTIFFSYFYLFIYEFFYFHSFFFFILSFAPGRRGHLSTHRRKISSSACSFSTEALTALCRHGEEIWEKKGEGVAEKRGKASRDTSNAASSLHRCATCDLSPTGAQGMQTPPQEQSDRGNSDSWRFRRQRLKGGGGALRWEGRAGVGVGNR
jgi:hypothetical protein